MDTLTPRQRDVLALLVWGLTRRAIADTLGISPWTVKNHQTEIYRALRVRNRTGAVVAVLRER